MRIAAGEVMKFKRSMSLFAYVFPGRRVAHAGCLKFIFAHYVTSLSSTHISVYTETLLHVYA